MNVLVIADPFLLPIPPAKYGGTERVIDLLCRGLHQRGHSVRLIAPAGSATTAELVVHPKQSTTEHFWYSRQRFFGLGSFALTLSRALKGIDVVHSFKAIQHWWPLQAFLKQPLVITLDKPVTHSHLQWLLRIRKRRLCLCSVSDVQRRGIPEGQWYTVYNGADVTIYPSSDKPRYPPYLLYLGRISPMKRTHIAIEVAQRCGLELIIAGNISSEKGGPEYFKAEVEPKLNDRIRWIGEVNDREKVELCGGALALLFPGWPEPFGLVMIESMLCGTPVIGFNHGSVPEVVEHGKTGYVVDTVEDMTKALVRIDQISRATCARVARERFSAGVMVERYLQIYKDLIGDTQKRRLFGARPIYAASDSAKFIGDESCCGSHTK